MHKQDHSFKIEVTPSCPAIASWVIEIVRDPSVVQGCIFRPRLKRYFFLREVHFWWNTSGCCNCPPVNSQFHPCRIGVGRLVSTKKMLFSGSNCIFTTGWKLGMGQNLATMGPQILVYIQYQPSNYVSFIRVLYPILTHTHLDFWSLGSSNSQDRPFKQCRCAFLVTVMQSFWHWCLAFCTGLAGVETGWGNPPQKWHQSVVVSAICSMVLESLSTFSPNNTQM